MKNALHVSKPTSIKRPTATQWRRVLRHYRHGLKPCPDSEYHFYHRTVRRCPECEKGSDVENNVMRAFYEEEKRRPIDFLIQGNRLVNKSLLALLFVGLIVLVHLVYSESPAVQATVNLATIRNNLVSIGSVSYYMAAAVWIGVSVLWILVVFVNLFMPKRMSKLRRHLIWKNIKSNVAYASMLIMIGVGVSL